MDRANKKSDNETLITINLSDEPIFSGNIVKKSNPIYNSTEKLHEERNEDYINVDPNENEPVNETKRDGDILPPE